MTGESAQKAKVLVFDDDKGMRASLEDLLSSAGFDPIMAASAIQAEDLIKQHLPDAILTDVRMPGRSGIELLQSLSTDASPPVILVSAHADIPMAVDAMQMGAYTFLEKPFDPRRLVTVLSHAADQFRLSKMTERLKSRLADLSGLNRIYLGGSQAAQDLRERVIGLADVNVPILISGETGTGKDLIARALHDLSRKSDQIFRAINCATIPVQEFEALMFGRKGETSGWLKAVDGGTLFLDEVHAAPLEVQAKLSRVLEEQRFTPLGSDLDESVSFRLISSLSEDPKKLVRDGRLREEFLYRIQRLELPLPALRDRKEDIPILFQHFLDDMARSFEMPPPELAAEDLAALLAHDWPGNVRELRSTAERFLFSTRVGGGEVATLLAPEGEQEDVPENLRGAVAAFEKTLLMRAIKAHEGRMDDAAAALGIGRRTLNEKMVKLGLNRDKIL
ncbi:MAG: sigma-54 dependent transcriptional regulator [Pseudomonadota bacterium]